MFVNMSPADYHGFSAKFYLCITYMLMVYLQPPKREMCTTCDKAVYQAERMEAGKNIYHKLCFKCTQCNMKLTSVIWLLFLVL